MTINLTVPNLAELKPRITVFGVGGAGGNAVNNMIQSQLDGVEFVVANTDAQALAQSSAERRIQMGTALTEGLGAGSQPQIGAAAAEEALPEVMDHLAGAHMVFITAGMGGGTGTGAAPVIARASKEQGILTVGVVTKPFQFEGQRRMLTAERGIDQLSKHVDTLIIIPNQNLFRVANEKTTFAAAFAMADQVLYSGVASITELMTKEGLINLDFADVRAVMSEMGKAMMGTGEASGEKRAVEAAEAAISNPLLDDVSMRGARGLLISITGGHDLTLYEVDEAATRIREEVDPDANIILGATFDESLEGIMRVSVVATGIEEPAEEAEDDGYADDLVQEAERSSYGYPGQPQQSYAEAPAAAPAEPKAAREPEPVQQAPAPAPMAEAEADELFETEEPAAAAYDEDIAAEQAIREQAARQAAPAQQPAMHDEQVAPQPQPRRPAAAAQPQQAAAPQPEEGGGNPRLPGIEDFPPVAQRQYAARHGNVEDLNAHAQKKQRKSLLERLASVGLGRRDEEDEAAAGPKAEPTMGARAERQQAAPMPTREAASGERRAAAAAAAAATAQAINQQPDPELDDDQLEIPAFLRRQAN